MGIRRADDASSDKPAVHHAEIVVEIGERHGDALLGFGRRLGLTSEDAQDGAQEVLLRLFRALRAGEPITDPRAWAFHAMYRLAIDEHRLRVRVSGLRERLVGAQRTAYPTPVDQTVRISIWEDVDRLPLRQRQVLYLRYRADLTYDDIALAMGITPSGARALAAEGLDRLRHKLELEETS